jgi:hypothetical protein
LETARFLEPSGSCVATSALSSTPRRSRESCAWPTTATCATWSARVLVHRDLSEPKDRRRSGCLVWPPVHDRRSLSRYQGPALWNGTIGHAYSGCASSRPNAHAGSTGAGLLDRLGTSRRERGPGPVSENQYQCQAHTVTAQPRIVLVSGASQHAGRPRSDALGCVPNSPRSTRILRLDFRCDMRGWFRVFA